MARISVIPSVDRLKAVVLVSRDRDAAYPSYEELKQAMQSHGVVYGIREEHIRLMTAQRIWDTRIDAAQGIAPQKGTPGRIEPLYDVSAKGRPQERSDGSVDHRDLHFITNVRKGEGLIRHIPPEPGTDGKDVMGNVIPAPRAGDIAMIEYPGTIISPDDPNMLIARITGAIIAYPDGHVEVVNEKKIQGDIDYSTGNVIFSGDLTVVGSVRTGFEVAVEGNLVIAGRVEDARVSSKGSLEIKGGAVGSGKGAIAAGKTILVRHMENMAATCDGDITVSEGVVNSRISSKGVVRAKSIVGGVTTTTRGLEAGELGNDAEVKTVVDCGGLFVLLSRKDACLKRIAHLVSEIGVAKELVFSIVRDSMDAEGNLPQEPAGRVDALKTRQKQYYDEMESLHKTIEDVDSMIADLPVPVIRAKKVFPNAVIRYGHSEKVIKDPIQNATISFDGGVIRFVE